MDIEFHYYITYLIADRAGFSQDECRTIAYASQYVDDNDICFIINKEKKNQYGNFISQTMDILKPKQQLMRIYPIFHFMPGDPTADSARRRDGKMHILNTIPNNKNANELFDYACCADSSIRFHHMGVASHVFVDTWAHQNFVGWYDNLNGFALNPLPDIGHADAKHDPDIPTNIWKDSRLVPENEVINNWKRFMDAGKHLYQKYRNYLTTKPAKSDWDTFEKQLTDKVMNVPMGESGMDERIRKYKEMVDFSQYNSTAWFDDAIETQVKGVRDSNNEFIKKYLNFFKDEYIWKSDTEYQNTNWYKFQEAVKAHERKALEILSPTFGKMSIDLKNS